ncbi:hypothetical protein NQ318_006168 [Aromia moschata]|uniref:GIY-YIG domain-containing protein n=1 Tax=Aromia moschata TaxID=1265417 RepID=A0AAV8XC96_9CUCU|nr:hypothetical protein NQ318_006168 [Aromia moschata]
MSNFVRIWGIEAAPCELFTHVHALRATGVSAQGRTAGLGSHAYRVIDLSEEKGFIFGPGRYAGPCVQMTECIHDIPTKSYNGEYFQQHEGTAMGNSLSPFIENLFMSNFETEVKDKFEYFPRVWFRYIPNDSHHPFQHKMASFNFLIHRLLYFPLSKERFEHEKQLIRNIAKSNGYSVYLIDKLIRKHKFKRTLYNSATFRRDTDNSKFASLPYEPKFTRRLDTIFKNININLTLLGNPKDKIDNNEKSGIYEISCKDCDQKYIGQTKRSILTRFKEHMAHLKYGRTEKSCVAQHDFDNNHRIDKIN